MPKKWYFLLVPLLLSVLIACFYQRLFNYAVELSFSRYFEGTGGHLHYRDKEFSDHTLVFHDVVLDFPSEQTTLNTPTLTLNYQIHYAKRSVDLTLSFENTSLSLIDNESNLEELLSRLVPNFSWLDIHTTITIPQGQLLITDRDANPQQEVPFRLNYSMGDKNEGNLLLFLDAECLEISLHTDAQSTTKLTAACSQIDGPALSRLGHALFPALTAWEIEQGTLTGNLTLAVPQKYRPYIEGHVFVENLAVAHPILGINARLDEGRMQFTPGYLVQAFGKDLKMPSLLGSIDLTKTGTLTFTDNGNTYATISNLSGKVQFDREDQARVHIEGLLSSADQQGEIRLQGFLDYPNYQKITSNLDLQLHYPETSPIKLSIRAFDIGLPYYSAELDLHHIRTQEMTILQQFLKIYAPAWNQIVLREGLLDASLKVSFHHHQWQDLVFEKISSRNLLCDALPWELSFGADKLDGQLSVDLSHANPLETLHTDLTVNNGRIQLKRPDQEPWEFSNIQTKLMVQNGIVQKSIASVAFAGMEGSVELDWMSPEEIMRLHFRGSGKDIAFLMPTFFQKHLETHFSKDLLTLEAGVKRRSKKLSFKGQIHLTDKELEQPIDFGFTVEKIAGTTLQPWLTDTPSKPQARTYEPSLFKSLVPSFLRPALLLHDRWFHHIPFVAGYSLSQGWFKARNVPLKKYLQPLFTQNENIALSGTSNLSGTFDNYGIALHYDLSHFVAEKDTFLVTTSTPPSNTLPGHYYFDFKSGHHFGYFPVHQGSYTNKTFNLTCSDVQGKLFFDNTSLHFQDGETSTEGLTLQGDLDIDLGNTLVVNCHAKEMQGTFSSMQRFFSHLNPSLPFLQLPLEGELFLRKPGMHVQMAFEEAGPKVDATIHAGLTQGTIPIEHAHADLQGLSFFIDYNHREQTLNLSRFEGDVILGRGDKTKTCVLRGKGCQFSNVLTPQATFDFHLYDNLHSFLSLVGTIDGSHFQFDSENTYFGALFPTECAFTLNHWSQLENLHFDSTFSLQAFSKELQRFQSAGLFFLSPEWLSEIDKLGEVDGKIRALLDFDGASSRLLFNCQGQNIAIANQPIQDFHLQGYRQDASWIVDELQIDRLSIGANITKNDDLWTANFIGLRYGKSLLLGLEGEYQQGDKAFNAKINLMELSLDHLKEWPMMEPFVEEFEPKGSLKATGRVHLEPTDAFSWNCDTVITADMRDVQLKNLHFREADAISCHLLTGRSLTLRNIKSTLHPHDAGFYIEKLHFDFPSKTTAVDNLSFRIPSDKLEKVAQDLHVAFPNGINSKTALIMQELKKEGNLEGHLSFTLGDETRLMDLFLVEDDYHYLHKDHHLNHFHLQLKGDDLDLFTHYRWFEKPLLLHGITSLDNLTRGQMIITDPFPQIHEPFPLVIHWRNTQETGFIVQRAEGSLCGLNVHLIEDSWNPHSSSKISLRGDVGVDMRYAFPLFPDTIQSGLSKWEVGKGYSLTGSWELSKVREPHQSQELYFNGLLEGKDCEMKGFCFQNLSAQVTYSPTKVNVHNLNISDPAGFLHINSITSVKDQENRWETVIPTLKATDISPSLLWEAGQERPTQRKPLVVQSFLIRDLHGNLSDETTFLGEGHLDFVNPVKKNVQNALLAIPAEILSRLGLDLSTLTPVRGSVFFQVKEGRFNLTKLKDIYSEGRLSKFYLPNNTYDHYVDFDGNIHAQIRMKHYTLLLKLAELFTVTVHGDLAKPRYTLQKQQRNKQGPVVEFQ